MTKAVNCYEIEYLTAFLAFFSGFLLLFGVASGKKICNPALVPA